MEEIRRNNSSRDQENITILNPNEAILVKLTRERRSRSYLDVSFKQVMNYLLCFDEQLKNPKDLLRFTKEIRTSFNSMCHKDRQSLGLRNDIDLDASFLLQWTTIEAIKYCVWRKFIAGMDANRLLGLLQRGLIASRENVDKKSRKFCVNFFHVLDKFLLDRIRYSGSSQLTFQGPRTTEEFYMCNEEVFQLWLNKIRPAMVDLSLLSDDPAECWRNSSLDLNLDNFETKTQFQMLVLSAKHLGDMDLIDGLYSLVSKHGSKFWCKSLESIRLNMKGYYQSNFKEFRELQKPDDSCVIELLEAHIETGDLDQIHDRINQLGSKKLKTFYREYLKSKTLAKVDTQRLEEVSDMLKTWSTPPYDKLQSSRNYLELMVPICLNTIVRISPEQDQGQAQRTKLISELEGQISQEFISQCLFSPSLWSNKMQIYRILLDMLKTNLGDKNKEATQNQLPCDIISQHRDDLKWNHVLLRNLHDMNLTEELKKSRDESFDLIRLKSVEFHLARGNQPTAMTIMNDLAMAPIKPEAGILNQLILMKPEISCFDAKWKQRDYIYTLMDQLDKHSDIDFDTKTELSLKLLRKILTVQDSGPNEERELSMRMKFCEDILNVGYDSFEQQEEEGERKSDFSFTRWTGLLDRSSLKAKAKTLSLFWERSLDALGKKDTYEVMANRNIDLVTELLPALCIEGSRASFSVAIKVAVRTLELICLNSWRLNESNIQRVSSPDFIKSTLPVWKAVKSNLLSVILYKGQRISERWLEIFIEIIKHLIENDSNLLLYSVIVNRLELQADLKSLKEQLEKTQKTLSPTMNQNQTAPPDTKTLRKNLQICHFRLHIWEQIFQHLNTIGDKNGDQSKWSTVVQETEKFIREIRKISFLCGEYLKSLTLRIPKRLDNYLDYFSKHANTNCGAITNKMQKEHSEQKLKLVCDHAISQLRVLINYDEKIGKTKLTKYEVWFMENLKKNLCECEYRLTLLAKKRPMILSELEKLVKSITELLTVCRNIILDYNRGYRQKMYMELISPALSRLKSTSIPIPECYDYRTDSASSGASPRAPVTIHKISQAVFLLMSKTSPKKLNFIGSDGKTRSFLLKAHEDLRLDQMIMEFFGSINNLLAEDKRTRDRYHIRRYSVTPMSSRSGLIEFVDAPSMCTFNRAWHNGPKGLKAMNKLFEETCRNVCGSHLCDSQTGALAELAASRPHEHCFVPETVQTVAPYYQLLWSKTKPSQLPVTKMRPSSGNTIKYRKEFKPEIFESIVRELSEIVPDELLSNQLWYHSANAHSYWLKTKQFINSTATMSIIGYIIGLGDRHMENILLEPDTGQVIHIDYNICFELGQLLSVPEDIPFRLTPNIVRAFGFAGLQGGFTKACINILTVMRENKSSVLSMLHPCNFGFMTQHELESDRLLQRDHCSAEQPTRLFYEQSPELCLVNQDLGGDGKDLLDLCSQESIGHEDSYFDSSRKIPGSEELNIDSPIPMPKIVTRTSGNASNKENSHLRMVPGDDNSSIVKSCLQASRAGNSSSSSGKSKKQQCTSNAAAAAAIFNLQEEIKTPAKLSETEVEGIQWRIDSKLSGCDSHLLSRCSEDPHNLLRNCRVIRSVEEQVDMLIRDSNSISRKATIFEGWASWV